MMEDFRVVLVGNGHRPRARDRDIGEQSAVRHVLIKEVKVALLDL